MINFYHDIRSNLSYPTHIIQCFAIVGKVRSRYHLFKNILLWSQSSNLNITLKVAYWSFFQFEKSSMSYLPSLENWEKN